MVSAFDRHGNIYEPVRIAACRNYKKTVTYLLYLNVIPGTVLKSSHSSQLKISLKYGTNTFGGSVYALKY
jgi:hypothetical protein